MGPVPETRPNLQTTGNANRLVCCKDEDLADCLLAFFSAALAVGAGPATPLDARKFIDDAEQKLLVLNVDASRADWVKSTYITDDTEAVAAKIDQRAIDATVRYAKQSTRFAGLKLDPETARKISLLKLSLTLATPSDPKESEELTRIAAGMEGAYGKGKYCPSGPESCKDLEELSKIVAESRDPKQLLDAWTGWHAIGRPMRKDFVRYVELANKGARQLGFADNGAMWRSKYDMPPEAFRKELDRLWEQVRPLYVSLHAYVRAKLREKYGDVVPANGPIPARLAGRYVGAGVGQHLSAGGAGQRRPGLRPDRDSEEARHRLAANGEVRRELLRLAGIRAASANVLGALAVHAAARSRRGMPRQRVGRGCARATCA